MSELGTGPGPLAASESAGPGAHDAPAKEGSGAASGSASVSISSNESTHRSGPMALEGIARAPALAENALLAGRYQIERELASGGMGRVFAGRDLRLDRPVAIKTLRVSSFTADAVARFQQEARAASALDEPSVLIIFDLGTEEGVPFLISELLHGETLRARLVRGPLNPIEASRLFSGVARGLAQAHARGIVHRDLKPENLFITRDGRMKILDFGVAKLLDRDTDPAHPVGVEAVVTSSGHFLGTVAYMSPEQVRGDPVDARADIFSFGAVLHEALTGKRPFRAGTPVETGYAILTAQPISLPAEMPPRLVDLVDRCLRKKLEERPQQMDELAATLGDLALGDAVPQSTRLFRRARRALPLLVAIGAVAALILTGASYWQRHAQTPLDARWIASSMGSSVPAARAAYLEGVAGVRKGCCKAAIAALLRATQLDPDFAQAFLLLAQWSIVDEPAVAVDALNKARRVADHLDARDRVVLEGLFLAMQGRAEEAEKVQRAQLSTRSDAESWAALGDLRFHLGPAHGWPESGAVEAFSRALLEDPHGPQALDHLIGLALVAGDEALAGSLAERILEPLDPRMPEALEYRWTAAWSSGNAGARAEVLDAVIASQDLGAQQSTWMRTVWGLPGVDDARVLAHRLGLASPLPLRKAQWLDAEALAELTLGHVRAADAALARAVAISRRETLVIHTAAVASIDWHRPSTSQLQETRALLAPMASSAEPVMPLAALHADGILSLRLGERTRAEADAAQLEGLSETSEGSWAHDFALSLRARLAVADGKRAEALALLEKMELHVGYRFAATFARLGEPMLRAQLLAEAGRETEALAWLQAFPYGDPMSTIDVAPRERLTAQLLEKQGRHELAAFHRARADLLWRSADPELLAEAGMNGPEGKPTDPQTPDANLPDAKAPGGR